MPASCFSAVDLEQIRSTTMVKTIDYRKQAGSTNDLALQRAAEAVDLLPLLVLTDRQTAGRGRGTHPWWSGPGALTFSLVIRRQQVETADSGTRISLTTGLAVCDALQQLRPGLEIGLKWPNDVFVRGRKICGILVEVPAPHADRVVIGIGVNVNNSVADAPRPLPATATALIDITGYAFDLTSVLIRILQQLHTHLAMLGTDQEQAVARWQSLCMFSDHTVRVQVGTRQIVGTCRGIDRTGALIVDTGQATERCATGIVSLTDDA